MALVMTPIYTQTVGAGGVATVTFNNIPQVYTDLEVVVSVRGTANQLVSDVFCSFSGQIGTNHSQTRLGGSGSSAFSDRPATGSAFRVVDGAAGTSTSNTFSSAKFYIPNYASTTTFKSLVVDGVHETNGTTAYGILSAVLYSSTSAISNIRFDSGQGSFAQYTTFTIYGIIRSGA